MERQTISIVGQNFFGVFQFSDFGTKTIKLEVLILPKKFEKTSELITENSLNKLQHENSQVFFSTFLVQDG